MRKSLYAAVFISGMTSLAIEMAASRLLGNYFGSSNLVWASIIGLILIYLTIGNYLGGAWADRSPRFATFYRILAWAGFTAGLLPVVARPVLRISANAFDGLQFGVLIGSFISVMVLFVIPVVLMGAASPFAIRLAMQDTRAAGSVAGRIYAISTLGSFTGTFLPVLVLIPLLGTFRTFIVFGGLLLTVGMSGLWQNDGPRAVLKLAWMPVVLLVLAIMGTRGFDKTTPGLLYEGESTYNYIQVLADGDYRLLRLNEGQGVHSIYHPTALFYQGPWEQVLVAPFFNPDAADPAAVESLAIVGLAAGTTARQAAIVFPNISIDGYEIDGDIVAVGRQYFGMDIPNLRVFVQDGRAGLNASDRRYQVISLDAYRPPYIPPHMVTREFFQIVREHLTADGVMVVNIGRGPDDRRLINALAATARPFFASLNVMDIPDTYNSILYASVQPTTIDNLAKNFNRLSQADVSVHPLLLEAIAATLANLQPEPMGGQVFTDDHAPIEWMTNNMILSFLLAGGSETMR